MNLVIDLIFNLKILDFEFSIKDLNHHLIFESNFSGNKREWFKTKEVFFKNQKFKSSKNKKDQYLEHYEFRKRILELFKQIFIS